MLNKIIVSLVFFNVLMQMAFGDVHPFCQNPKADPDFDFKLIKEDTPETGAYILYGNKVARQHWSQFLHGKELSPDEDFSQLCAKIGYHAIENKAVLDYRGFGNLITDANCTILQDGGIDCIYVSRNNSSYSDEARIYIPYIDKKDFGSYRVVVYCFENEEIGWALNGLKRRRITEEDKAIIFTQLESFGIDTKDTVEMFEDSCDQ